jgi:HD-GYP domain-containing protein (c-di-GMP phosphodiesterase class II)
LNADGIDVVKHSAVESAFGYHFAKPGKIDPKFHRMLMNARKIREIADYDMDEEIVEPVELAARIYDIGMVNIPAEILQEGERLEGLKLSLYQSYPEATYDTLKKIECIWSLANIVLEHRERFDGSGFPKGIKGEAILIQARILAVAHAVADLTTHRSYRNAFSIDQALKEISAQSCSKYDPEVVAACLRLFKEKGYKMEG